MKQNKKNNVQDRHRRKLLDFFNSAISEDSKDGTIVLFNQYNRYRKTTSLLDKAIFKTQIESELNLTKYW